MTLNDLIGRAGGFTDRASLPESRVVRIKSEELNDPEAGRIRDTPVADRTEDDALLAEVLDTEAVAGLDRFVRVQLADVVRVCRQSRSLSDAGRTLFAESRKRRKRVNDADRLRKYLATFDLSWDDVRGD